MLRVSGNYKYIVSYSAGIDFRRQHLTYTQSTDPRAVRFNASDGVVRVVLKYTVAILTAN